MTRAAKRVSGKRKSMPNKTKAVLAALLFLGFTGFFLVKTYILPETHLADQPRLQQTPPDLISSQQLDAIDGLTNTQSLVTETTFRTPKTPDHSLFSTSLQGTDIDGQLSADANGNLILDLATRDFFDYFLSASAEVGVEATFDEIMRYANSYLPETAAKQAGELLGQYMRYKKASFELQRTPLNQSEMNSQGYITILQNTFEQLKKNRSSLFSDAANSAFFSVEDAYADYTLKSMSVQSDPSLSDAQKSVLLASHRETLPSRVKASLTQRDQQNARQQRVADTVKSSTGDSEVFDQLIDEGYDQSQADQIIAYRQQQTNFEQRYDDYALKRDSILQLGLEKQKTSAKLDGARKHYFVTPQEQTQAKLRDLSIVGDEPTSSDE